MQHKYQSESPETKKYQEQAELNKIEELEEREVELKQSEEGLNKKIQWLHEKVEAF